MRQSSVELLWPLTNLERSPESGHSERFQIRPVLSFDFSEISKITLRPSKAYSGDPGVPRPRSQSLEGPHLPHYPGTKHPYQIHLNRVCKRLGWPLMRLFPSRALVPTQTTPRVSGGHRNHDREWAVSLRSTLR